MKRFIIIIGILIFLFVLIFGGGIFYLTLGLKSGSKVVIDEIDVSNVEDGVYRGIYKSGRWTNEVEVTVLNNKITDIIIIEDVTFVKEGVSEELFQNVIENQNINVEIVSGATVSSNAYLKAIEDALNN